MTCNKGDKSTKNHKRPKKYDNKDRTIRELNNRITLLQKSIDVINSAPTGIYEIDFRGPRFISVNDYICQVLGYTREEIMAMDPFDFLDEDSKQVFKERIRKQLGGERVDDLVEYKGRAKDGRVLYWVLKVAFTYSNGKSRGAIVVANEITERKLAEKMLHEKQLELVSQAMELKLHMEELNAKNKELERQIEERKRAEVEISRLASIVNSCEEAIMGKTLDGVITSWNMGAERLYGYSELEVIGKPIDIILPENRSHEKPYILDRIKRGEGIENFETVRVAKNGSRVDVSLTISPIKDSTGKVIGLSTIARDITKRKQTEDALRESERKFSVLAETSPAAILVYQGKKNLYVNRAAELLSGYTKEELISIDYFDLIHPDYLEFIKDRAFALYKGQHVPQRYEVKVKTKNGAMKWVDVSAGFTDFMGSPAGIITAMDITENKLAEEERERLLKEVDERNARLKAIIDALPVGLFIYDIMGVVLVRNEMAAKIWGGIAPMIKKRDDFDVYRAWWADTNKSLMYEERATARALKGETVIGLMLDIQRFDGLYRTILVSSAPMRDSKGSILGAVVINQDITEIRKMEKELLEAKMQAELYLDLMGHDINNMHQIALGYLELAKNMPPGEEQTKFLDKPVEVLLRSAQLIDNVRKLQKLREGMFQNQDIDLIPLLMNIQKEYGALPNKRIILNINGNEHCFVRANELLHDIYTNLITNAIRHTGNKTDITLDLDIVKDNGVKYCRLSVEDNGPGIPDDKKATIFNRTLKGSNKTRGMGLGLYIVKTLVDTYGGRVYVEDRVPGDYTKGVKFMVMLPVYEK